MPSIMEGNLARPARRTTSTVAALILCVVVGAAFAGAFAQAASASRPATAKETRGMWRAVDREMRKHGGGVGRCVQHRGRVSTVRGQRFRYGTVLIADNQCGNGTFVLRQRPGGGVWRFVTAGSDIGFPERCADDLKLMGVKVFKDLFPTISNCP